MGQISVGEVHHVITAAEVAAGAAYVSFTPDGVFSGNVPQISEKNWLVWLASLWVQTPGAVNKEGLKLGITAVTYPNIPLDFFHELQADHTHACFIGPVKVNKGVKFYVVDYARLAVTDILHCTIMYEVTD